MLGTSRVATLAVWAYYFIDMCDIYHSNSKKTKTPIQYYYAIMEFVDVMINEGGM